MPQSSFLPIRRVRSLLHPERESQIPRKRDPDARSAPPELGTTKRLHDLLLIGRRYASTWSRVLLQGGGGRDEEQMRECAGAVRGHRAAEVVADESLRGRG